MMMLSAAATAVRLVVTKSTTYTSKITLSSIRTDNISQRKIRKSNSHVVRKSRMMTQSSIARTTNHNFSTIINLFDMQRNDCNEALITYHRFIHNLSHSNHHCNHDIKYTAKVNTDNKTINDSLAVDTVARMKHHNDFINQVCNQRSLLSLSSSSFPKHNLLFLRSPVTKIKKQELVFQQRSMQLATLFRGGWYSKKNTNDNDDDYKKKRNGTGDDDNNYIDNSRVITTDGVDVDAVNGAEKTEVGDDDHHLDDNNDDQDFVDPTVMVTDVSKRYYKKSPYYLLSSSSSSDTENNHRRGHYISTCSVQGFRSYMEDDISIHPPDFVGVYDGHGGKAISRYLRMNLYNTLINDSLPIIIQQQLNNRSSYRYHYHKRQLLQEVIMTKASSTTTPEIMSSPSVSMNSNANLSNIDRRSTSFSKKSSSLNEEMSEDSFANFAAAVQERQLQQQHHGTQGRRVISSTNMNMTYHRSPFNRNNKKPQHHHYQRYDEQENKLQKSREDWLLRKQQEEQEELERIKKDHNNDYHFYQKVKRKQQKVHDHMHRIVFPAAPSRKLLNDDVIEQVMTSIQSNHHNDHHLQQRPSLSGGSNNVSNDQTKQQQQYDPPPTTEEYQLALRHALKRCDENVLNVQNWNYQGSTALCCWIHIEDQQQNQQQEKQSQYEVEQQQQQPQPSSAKSVSSTSKTDDQKKQTLIVANVGDSRAVFSRNRVAYDVTRDHKPNDPLEQQLIYDRGGQVIWDGDIHPNTGEPMTTGGHGVYRVNGNLAVSRVIGDKLERPYVTSDPDVIAIPLKPNEDDFIILASDGLWDVMTSLDVVAYIHALLDNHDDDHNHETNTIHDYNELQYRQDTVTSMIVEEALRRGSSDNITVLIVWLGNNYYKQAHGKKRKILTTTSNPMMMNEEMPFP